MRLAQYAQDWYGSAAGPQRLTAQAAILFAALVLVFVGVHLLRRAFGRPVSAARVQVAAEARLRKYRIGARLYHWGNLVFLLLLAVSGIALFTPKTGWRFPWLLTHEIAAGLFILSLLLHIVIAPRRGEGRSMWFERRDWSDLGTIVANFFGKTRAYPAFGKYDPLQKVYHAFITMLSAGVIFSGVYLISSAEVWATFSHGWMRAMRLTHDVAGFAFIAIIVGHIYFGIMRTNWPELVAMITGHIRGTRFNQHHDAARWRPE